MGVKIYSSLKDLRSQESDIYEFGESLKDSKISKAWGSRNLDDYGEEIIEEEDDSFSEEDEEVIDYPWDDFSYVIIPDTNKDNSESQEIGEKLGLEVRKYRSHDPEFTFFVVI